ncbi:nuclease A inhibitor family protein [Armatimonas sp.]|uniref:nuclease A inhibitor family protein n=1 Tax=Armatimonas sp. TaxID=1872638 RepID=UPI003751510C
MSVLTELRTAAKGLLFLSESDAPLKAFVWKGVAIDSAATLLKQLHKDAATPVQEIALTDFFAPMSTVQSWHDEAARADVVRFQALVAQLAALTNTRVFRIGTGPEILAYALGTTPDGHTAGVSTLLTET